MGGVISKDVGLTDTKLPRSGIPPDEGQGTSNGGPPPPFAPAVKTRGPVPRL